MTDAEMARLLGALADLLAGRGYRLDGAAGIVRQAARRLAQLDTGTGPRCDCGADIPHRPGPGRPRRWCATCRPPRARNPRKLES